MAFTRLTYSTRTDDCYHVLKRSILDLDLSPGAPLDEVRIAAQLGISKTPVREALARLAGEGFVVSRPGRKNDVADLSLAMIREIYQVRMLLESASIREVTATMAAGDLDELERFVEAGAEALTCDDRLGWVDANKRFHALLIERSGNRCLIDIVRRLADQADRVRAAIFRSEQRVAQFDLSRQGIENHRAIVAALRMRDAERAAAMTRHDIQTFLDAVDTPAMQAAFEQLAHRPARTIG